MRIFMEGDHPITVFGDLHQCYWHFTGVLICIFCHSGKGYLCQQFQFLWENLKKFLGLNTVLDSAIDKLVIALQSL